MSAPPDDEGARHLRLLERCLVQVPARSDRRASRPSAVDEVPDDEDDHGAEDGDDDARDVESGDVGDAEDRSGDEATHDRPDDAEDDRQDDALVRRRRSGWR